MVTINRLCYIRQHKFFGSLKHIDIKFLVVKVEFIVVMSIEHIGTNSMIADPRVCHIRFFHEHIALMGVVLSDNVLV